MITAVVHMHACKHPQGTCIAQKTQGAADAPPHHSSVSFYF